MADPIKFEPIEFEEIPLKERLANAAGTGLDYLGRGFDYLGGLTRTGAAGIGELVTGKDLYKEGDIGKAVAGQAPTSSEILARGGAGTWGNLSDVAPGFFSDTGEGWKLKKGGAADITGRGAAGFALDTALDPLTYASLGVAPIGKKLVQSKIGQTLLKPLAKSETATGRKIFGFGIKKAEEVAEQYGKAPVKDILLKYDISGSYKNIQRQSKELVNELMEKRKQLYDLAHQKGAVMDVSGSTREAQRYINELSKINNDRAQSLAKTFQAELDDLKRLEGSPSKIVKKEIPASLDEMMRGSGAKKIVEEVVPGEAPASLAQASKVKSLLYEGAGNEAWNKIKDSSEAKEFLKKLSLGVKEGIEKSADKIEPGLGTQIKQLNNEVGTLLSERKLFNKEALKEVNQNLFTPVDALALTIGGPAALGTKKAADLLKMPGIRTRIGSALYKEGLAGDKLPIHDILLRRSLVESQKEPVEGSIAFEPIDFEESK